MKFLRNNISRCWAILCSIAISASIAILSVPQEAYAAEYGIDLIEVCNYQLGPGSTNDVANVTNNVMGWKCAKRYRHYVHVYPDDINLSRYCAYKYGNNYGAYYRDFNNKYSWYCGPKK